MEVGSQSADGLFFVGKKEDLITAKRTVLTLNGRDVLIVHHLGNFYAIDCYCYHAGTSLQGGDIEDIDSKLCIICPKHKYKITLSVGEGLYRGRDRSHVPTQTPPEAPPLRWYSKGVKQRVHQLTERQGALFLHLSTAGWVESDFFQGERGKVQRERAAAALKNSDDEEQSTE